MFELTDAVVEAIIFAMEDQEGNRRINIETGEVVIPEPGTATDDLSLPPEWSSRDGYRLMEDFLKTIRNPSARHELQGALGRGRGVFKAFKEVLASFPEIERTFHDFKLKTLRAVIRDWYDGLCEARGLSRLGAEPEDTEELITSELGISVEEGTRQLRMVLDLVAEAEEEGRDILPSVIVASEADSLRTRLSASADWLCAYVPDGEGGAIGVAAALREHAAGRSFGRVVFLYVLQDFRRSGVARSLLAALQRAFSAEDHALLVLDSAFLPEGFAERLPAIGLKPYGCRGYFQP